VPAPATTKSVSGAEVEASVREAVANCKSAVAGARAAPASARAELTVACNKVVNLTGKEARELREAICGEVANASSGVESARERTRRACELAARG